MSMQDWAPWCFTVTAIASQLCLGKKMYQGWVIAAIAAAACVLYNFLTRQYGFIPTNIIMCVMAIRNFISWRK